MKGWKNVETQRAYLAPRIRRWYPNFITGGERYRRLLERLAQPDAVVLDAGAGDGGYIHHLKGRVKKIIGVDVHQRLLEKNSIVDEKIVADLAAIPLPDASVDVITAEFVLEHLEHPVPVFREWQRILKPGGLVIALTPNIYNPLMFFSRLTPLRFHRWVKHYILKKSEHVHQTFYRANTSNTIQNLCESTGLAVHAMYRAGNPEYLALHPLTVIPSIIFERLQSLPGLRWLQMYLVVEIKKPITP